MGQSNAPAPVSQHAVAAATFFWWHMTQQRLKWQSLKYQRYLKDVLMMYVSLTKTFFQADELPKFTQSDSSDGSANSTCERLVYLPNLSTTNVSDSAQTLSSCSKLPNFHDFSRGLAPRDYEEKAMENKTPPNIRFARVSEPTVPPNHLTQIQKQGGIFNPCQRTGTFRSSSEVKTSRNTFTLLKKSSQ